MDDKAEQKSRRPLPNPASPPVQRPNTPVPLPPEGISPLSFYGARPAKRTISPSNQLSYAAATTETYQATAPPLPSRPRGLGSSHTTILSPDPPLYSSYREPELVTDDITVDDEIPPLQDSYDDWNNNTWGDTPAASWGLDTIKSNVPIERSALEETKWWDGKTFDRPGPGYLPPTVETLLHDQDHTIFSVTASTPQASRDPPSVAAPGNKSYIPPTEQEVRTAIPHANAYYCPKDNGWNIISWKHFSHTPPLSKEGAKRHKLPDSFRRMRASCLEDAQHSNKTHHFHKYDKAIDSSRLTPAYTPLEDVPLAKQRNRTTSIIDAEIDVAKMLVDEIDDVVEETGFTLDVYVCCQCLTYCSASPLIPGIISNDVWTRYTEDRRANPAPGRTGQVSVYASVEKILSIVEALLWQSQTRSLKISNSFLSSIGFNDDV